MKRLTIFALFAALALTLSPQAPAADPVGRTDIWAEAYFHTNVYLHDNFVIDLVTRLAGITTNAEASGSLPFSLASQTNNLYFIGIPWTGVEDGGGQVSTNWIGLWVNGTNVMTAITNAADTGDAVTNATASGSLPFALSRETNIIRIIGASWTGNEDGGGNISTNWDVIYVGTTNVADDIAANMAAISASSNASWHINGDNAPTATMNGGTYGITNLGTLFFGGVSPASVGVWASDSNMHFRADSSALSADDPLIVTADGVEVNGELLVGDGTAGQGAISSIGESDNSSKMFSFSGRTNSIGWHKGLIDSGVADESVMIDWRINGNGKFRSGIWTNGTFHFGSDGSADFISTDPLIVSATGVEVNGNVNIVNTAGGIMVDMHSTGANSVPAIHIENDANAWEINVQGLVDDQLYIKDVTGGRNTFVFDRGGGIQLIERIAAPTDPTPGEGQGRLFISNGSLGAGLGSDGDLMYISTAGGITKTNTIVTF